MKNTGFLVLVCSLFLSTWGHASESLLTQCRSLDGDHQVLILKTRPLGFLATESLSAILIDKDTPIAKFSNLTVVVLDTQETFIVDQGTMGKRFALVLPSGKDRDGSLRAVFGDTELWIDEYLECGTGRGGN